MPAPGAIALLAAGLWFTAAAAPPSPPHAALDAYTAGRELIAGRATADVVAALAHFSRAAALDPEWAPAHAGRAQVFALLYDYPNAKLAALRALELDPDLAEAHAALGFARLHGDWDWAGAQEALRRAVALDPESALAHSWMAVAFEVVGQRWNISYLESEDTESRVADKKVPGQAVFLSVDREVRECDGRFERPVFYQGVRRHSAK